jgi:hypothetical protein
MAVIMRFRNFEGERRCDARCHKAEHHECTCICGGRYHGVAVDRAAPRNIVEAELLVQGLDHSQLSRDELQRISQHVPQGFIASIGVPLDLFREVES